MTIVDNFTFSVYRQTAHGCKAL